MKMTEVRVNKSLKDLRGLEQVEVHNMFFTAWFFASEEDKPKWRKKLDQLQSLWDHAGDTSAIWEQAAEKRLNTISAYLDERIPETT